MYARILKQFLLPVSCSLFLQQYSGLSAARVFVKVSHNELVKVSKENENENIVKNCVFFKGKKCFQVISEIKYKY